MKDNTIRASTEEILVVDDNYHNIRFLSKILTQQGYKVRKAVNAQLAMNAVESFTPDLILLDIMMPDMDGYQLCEYFKSNIQHRKIPIIFMSALDGTLDKDRAFRLGAADYLTKPLQIEEILSKVNIQLSLLHMQNLLIEQAQQLREESIARKQAEENYRSIFENAINGMCQTTKEGKFIKANLALAQMYGYESPDELMDSIPSLNQNFYVRSKRRDEFLAYMEVFETVQGFESEIYRQDGSTLWISENVRKVVDAKGNFLYFEEIIQDVTEKRAMETELQEQRRVSEELLLNILPQYIAEKLKRNRHNIADFLPEVAVLFADLVGFTELSAKIDPTKLVDLLNEIFSAFDQLTSDRGLEKIKTIGDAYMVVGGLPRYGKDRSAESDPVEKVVNLALSMQAKIQEFQRPILSDTHSVDGPIDSFELRIGINAGPVVAGVIGVSKFQLDLWGDTVNIASRMESQGEPGKIQVTEAIYERLKDRFSFAERGQIDVKGRGDMTTYWLLGKLPDSDSP